MAIIVFEDPIHNSEDKIIQTIKTDSPEFYHRLPKLNLWDGNFDKAFRGAFGTHSGMVGVNKEIERLHTAIGFTVTKYRLGHSKNENRK